nr:amidohydrolase family protein [Gorillibacterium massiliense]
MKKGRFGLWKTILVSFVVLVGCVLLIGYLLKPHHEPQQVAQPIPTVEPTLTVAPTSTVAPTEAPVKSMEEWAKEYGSLPLADAHNHGSVLGIAGKLVLWGNAGIDRVVLFGEVSKEIAVTHDIYTWEYYKQHPELIIPFFSGINLKDPAALQVARDQLEKGFFGIGEIAAASTYSPAVSGAEWKADDPMDGILPQLYKLCAEYKAPLLLHIDPPSGLPIFKLEEALEAYPDTTIIFGHANAYNSPQNIESLLKAHSNLYIDIFAGFTAFNPDSTNKLEDFVDVIREFPDRFMLSTDSGYDMERGEEQAIEGMYQMLDLLKDDPVLMRKVAYDNLDALIRNQPATKTQKDQIRELDKKIGSKHDLSAITKLEAGRILAEADQ